MSSEALAWAFKINLKPSALKFTLVALCECANYQTGHIYPSLAHLEEITGQDRKTLIANVAKLELLGLIVDTGERAGRTGQIKVYRATTETVPKTEQSKKRNSSVFPSKQSQKRNTEPSREPSIDKAKALPTARARKISKEVGWSCIPKSWFPPAIEALPQQARACAEKWTAASYAAHGEAFHSFWRSSGKKLADWDTRWAERVITMHSQIMRDQKYGTAPTDTAPKTITKPMTAAELHRAIDFNRTTGNARRADELAAELARLTGPPNEVHAF